MELGFTRGILETHSGDRKLVIPGDNSLIAAMATFDCIMNAHIRDSMMVAVSNRQKHNQFNCSANSFVVTFKRNDKLRANPEGVTHVTK